MPHIILSSVDLPEPVLTADNADFVIGLNCIKGAVAQHFL